VKWGVRFLDLRVSVDNKGVPGIYHGRAGYANRTLNQVLLGLRNFLHKYDSECVVLCFDYEYKETAQKSIEAIEALLYSASYRNYVYDKSEVPHLNDVRGKMIYWRRYGDYGIGPGLKVNFPRFGEVKLYENAYLHSQDEYACTGEEKYSYIVRSLDYARNYAGIKPDRLNLCVCFTSYYNKVPAPKIDGPKMNQKVNNDIVNWQRANYNYPINLGIIASDYVSSKYVNTVLGSNFLTNY